MANTREEIGEQGVLDGLVSNTLTSLEENTARVIGPNALQNNTALTSLVLPRAATIAPRGIAGCTGLNYLELPNLESIGEDGLANNTNLAVLEFSGNSRISISDRAFRNSTALAHLLIRGNTVHNLLAASAFNGTRIAIGEGAIYVPTDLISSYETATNWSNFFIADLADYPITSFDTITDTWADIAEAEADGSYLNKYMIGDTKTMTVTIGTSVYAVRMEIMAFDTDTLDGSTEKAHITWFARTLFMLHAMNTANEDTLSWKDSALRGWMNDTVYNGIEPTVKSMIKTVTKHYYDAASESTLSCGDKVFVPSIYELGYQGTEYTPEDTGVYYGEAFGNQRIDSTARNIFTRYALSNATATGYWTRTQRKEAQNRFCLVANGGTISHTTSSSGSFGVEICICT